MKTELVFITVPPPRSGNVVEYVSDLAAVKEAAAVYTNIDVILLVQGTDKIINTTINQIQELGSPIQNIERCRVDKVIKGESAKKGRVRGHDSTFIYVRVKIDTEAANFEFAVNRFAKVPEVRYLYPIKESSEIILQALAPNKIALDNMIMNAIQQETHGMVKHTRTFITINNMHWSDEGIPRSRTEYLGTQDLHPVFMSLSDANKDQGINLSNHIYADTQIKVWHYGLIKAGAKSWSDEIDCAIDGAEAYIFLITKEFLDSPECQREFGRIEGMAKPGAVCCLVMPPLTFSELPHRYSKRQCIDGNSFNAYRNLVQWIEENV